MGLRPGKTRWRKPARSALRQEISNREVRSPHCNACSQCWENVTQVTVTGE